MHEVTLILSAIEHGDPCAAEQLLSLVYDELRRLAAQKLAHEVPGQTLDPTALVHEAYLRLFGNGAKQHWDSRRHFFASAAEAMRRILIETARRKKRVKHGGNRQQLDLLDQNLAVARESPDELLALDEALMNLAKEDPTAADVVKLRFFTGLSIEQAGEVLGFSRATAYRHWNYARAWLQCEIQGKRGSAGI
ncbi:MAG: sigma-70 family RNA polymerase sigma factor [Planctomycetia bacterium]|nr:sigma-70 family RNA polymerase sigma factor [Planctomycetia bacterium]